MDSEMDVEIDCEASDENILVNDELDTDKLVLTARIDPAWCLAWSETLGR